MALPADLERGFHRELLEFEEETKMRHVTTIERFAREEGRDEGRQEGSVETAQAALLDVLELRFTDIPTEVDAAVRGIADAARLLALHRLAITTPSLEEFARALQE